MIELTAPVVQKNNEKRIVYGPVLIPNEPDHDGDRIRPEKIEQVAHMFSEQYGNVDLQHSLNNVGKMVESYIAPTDLDFGEVTVPKGSWMMGVRVTDSASWEAVKSGRLTGFSIMGIRSAVMKSKEVTADEIQAATKRTTLKDLGEDWIVNAVSLVDEPAVPKAKFLVVKSKKDPSDEESFFAKLKSFFQTETSIEGGETMDREEMVALVKSTVAEVLKEQQPDEDEQQEPEPIAASAEENEVVTLSKNDFEALLEGDSVTSLGFLATVGEQTLRQISDGAKRRRMRARHNNMGVGKSHLQMAIAKAFIQQGIAVLVISDVVFMDELMQQKASSAPAFHEQINQVADIPVLVWDDLGKSNSSEAKKSAYFRIIDERYRNKKPILFSSNEDTETLEDRIGDAAASRLLGMSRIYTVEGPDYRIVGQK